MLNVLKNSGRSLSGIPVFQTCRSVTQITPVTQLISWHTDSQQFSHANLPTFEFDSGAAATIAGGKQLIKATKPARTVATRGIASEHAGEKPFNVASSAAALSQHNSVKHIWTFGELQRQPCRDTVASLTTLGEGKLLDLAGGTAEEEERNQTQQQQKQQKQAASEAAFT